MASGMPVIGLVLRHPFKRSSSALACCKGCILGLRHIGFDFGLYLADPKDIGAHDFCGRHFAGREFLLEFAQ